MKKAVFAVLLLLLWTSFSLWHWLGQPNNFLYTLETTGKWSASATPEYKARGYLLRIDAACAAPVYKALRPPHPKPNSPDFLRFSANRESDVEFHPEEISTPSRFKWLSENYTTYDDPGLAMGIRYSFRNRCLYDLECTLQDSMDYLFIKIGVRYFASKEQLRTLQKCVAATEVFYRLNTSYNFGRSDRHHRNGILVWLAGR